MLNKFWIVLPLSRDHNQALRVERFDSSEAAEADAKDQATTKPTVEGYAVMECMLITAAPVVTVALEEPAAARVKIKSAELLADAVQAL